MSEVPQISVVIPTVGRVTLSRAVASALRQEIPDGSLELIVVNDSGSPLAIDDPLLADSRVTIVDTNKRGQSVARNSGAAVSNGRYLYFLDDDDYLARGALASLLEIIIGESQFIVAYGGMNLVNRAGKQLGEVNLGETGNLASHLLAGAFISLGTALIRTDAFFNIGEINPRMKFGEDIDVFRRLAMVGDFVNTPAPIFNALRGAGWNSSVDFNFDFLRLSRENMLDHEKAFTRFINSAQTPYWHGRIFKAYLVSSIWNLRHMEFSKSISRMFYTCGALLAAGIAVFSVDFWKALRDNHVPATIHRVLYSQP